ncbi:hypothetical protein CC1G_03392 [Coprinopsis cinerea okayama7|uniref:Uncharacterized protein n=1 Tax=Coprinopsis cinerea (strain Okayama-7 / 130 / ATCC MYA-4618 / FGSC 9003) TaxID=240176 RepID=A8NQJ5_COPC7|nr:hypothetical protein CC1G_03392 [Coprinopsis cinerea okayama7\|eukprot:XP_001835610.1 hypothetical protein CC1G_03392 [Coprinopsis cinerea okayama7\
MPVHTQNPHGTTAYAPPVTCRAASPASSIGTQYGDDATPEDEMEMDDWEFEEMCLDRIRLRDPRPEEELAERDPLVTDPARGKGGDAEQALFEKILQNLRAEIKRLDDEEIYERALLKGSQIGLEIQAPTTDIDKIMRSMMGSALSLGAPDRVQRPVPADAMPEDVPTQPVEEVAPGPWNNYGKKPPSLAPHIFPRAPSLAPASPTNSVFAPASSIASALTTTASTTATSPMGEEMTVDNHIDAFKVRSQDSRASLTDQSHSMDAILFHPEL